MTSEHITRLQETPVFGGLRADALEFLVDASKQMTFPAGTLVIREGDLGDKIYVIEAGRVEVVKALGDDERVLKVLGPGECFGEMALLDISPRSATVRAMEDCRALEIPAAALFKLYERDLEQFTLLTLNMGREVSRRLRETERMLSRRA
ncbi:MAG: cyclic nucleotide-binding domain-containing protein [Zoogloeaceae bacterium]|nr:cyclic nucleotide-binding domain-containing protein [Zoogloeaceae bacterium]